MSYTIRTIEDMERMYYSKGGFNLINPSDITAPFLTKDAPVTISTTGVYQATYGAQAWIQVNMEANTFGALPKFPWTRSGWRVITARAGNLTGIGVAEAGSLPASVKPTFAQASTIPKTVPLVFENSEVHEYLGTDGGDDAYATLSDLRSYMAGQHKESMNAQLNNHSGNLAGNDFESIDRMCGSYQELNDCTDAENASYDAGDLDPFASASFDRDGGATWADAYVSENDATDRAISDTIIHGLLQNTLNNGANANGQWWQTGYDTWSAINLLWEPQTRFNMIGSAKVQVGVNGIQSNEGIDVGVTVSSLIGKPLIVSKDTVAETGGISRLYLIDSSNPEGFDYPRMFIKVAKPTQYFEAGMAQGTPFSVSKFSTKGMYRTVGELKCSFFKAQGKARDLKS